MNPHDLINAVFWMGVSGGALTIGSIIAILMQGLESSNNSKNSSSSNVEFDEFYDANDRISYEKTN